MNEFFEIGDLVRLKDSYDKARQLGFVVGISPRSVHVKSQGVTHSWMIMIGNIVFLLKKLITMT
jgi:hypothetical protein